MCKYYIPAITIVSRSRQLEPTYSYYQEMLLRTKNYLIMITGSTRNKQVRRDQLATHLVETPIKEATQISSIYGNLR